MRRSTRIRKPVDKYAAVIAERSLVEPKTLKEAMGSPQSELWKNAMKEEFNSLIDNKTWEYCDLPTGKKAIKSKWCFKIKKDCKGNVERYKARLVVKGFTQQKDIDYYETFSPVVRYSFICFDENTAQNANGKYFKNI